MFRFLFLMAEAASLLRRDYRRLRAGGRGRIDALEYAWAFMDPTMRGAFAVVVMALVILLMLAGIYYAKTWTCGDAC